MAEDVKIIFSKDYDDDFSKSMGAKPNTGKDGSSSSRIPRLNRRASTSTDLNSSFGCVSSLNQSLDVIYRLNEQKTKRHHSIHEGNSFDYRKELESSLTLKHTSSPLSCDSHLLDTTRLSASSVKRHKSFTGGDRPTLKHHKSMVSLDQVKIPLNLASRASSPNRSPRVSKLSRSKSISSLESARRDGILSVRSMKATKAIKDPGRVQVFVRIRPPNETEDVGKYPIAVSIEDEEQTQLKVFDGKNDRCYQFDGVLPECSDNKEVYKTVAEPLVYSALCGFNGILMCYGQTGTGKTYSLMSNDGMSVRIVYKCFKVINNDKRHKYTVTCSYLQIYQEKIFDLLNETQQIELSLREHPKTGVYIENLTEYVVHSPKEVLRLLKVGKRRLVFAETKMNRVSSRSHAICQLKILKERLGTESSSSDVSSPSLKTPDITDDDDDFYDQQDILGQSMNSSYQSLIDNDDDDDNSSNITDLEDGVTSVRGKLYICDLAGSERIKKTKASGERLHEALHINSSLLELGNVIQALAEGSRSHVPFRNSSLTRLLQEGLSGNCKTRLVVCVAPTIMDVHETKCSLNFGSRAMKVQVTAHVNYDVDYKRLAESLSSKLETLEHGWNVQKEDYEKLITQLKLDVSGRRATSPSSYSSTGTNSKHVQALLVVELMTLQLFYNLQRQSRQSPDQRFSIDNQDLLLQSMEGLLELLCDYIRDRTVFRSKLPSNHSSSSSSVITSPDYMDSILSVHDIPGNLEPIARFIEHAQITAANANGSKKLELVGDIRTRERFKRVMDGLLQLKDKVSKSAVKCLKETFESAVKDTSFTKMSSLDDVVAALETNKELFTTECIDDTQALESSLHFLLLDKALLSCLVLLKAQSGNLLEGWKSGVSMVDEMDVNAKKLLSDLQLERGVKNKLQDELYALREDKMMVEEKLKDIELDLKTVRELKENLEKKLCAVADRNHALEEQMEITRAEKEKSELRLVEVEKKRMQLESSLKNSDNNNAKKERQIVDLKNEKVALDSLVATLKEELNLLEREKSRDSEEKKHIQEELEDIKDRNIILETEWSCCREENGLLENELTALEEDKAMLEEELVKYRDDVRMLEEAVSVLEAQASDYKHDIITLKAKEDRMMSTVRSEKEKFNKEINSLRQEMSALRVERRRFQRDISVARADKSNTERAYTALKGQKESIQDDIASYKLHEKRMQREVASLKNDRAKLEREVNTLKVENNKLKSDLMLAEKLKTEVKLLQKNEDKIVSIFSFEKDKIVEQLSTFKEKFTKLEVDFTKVCNEKERLVKQLKKWEQSEHKETRRAHSQPTPITGNTPPEKMKASMSMQGALVRRSVHSGEVSEVEGRVLDLQRRLAFFMAEREDIQKELITSREKNSKLTAELKLLENDTSKIQTLLSTLSDEKVTIETRLVNSIKSKEVLEKEKELLQYSMDGAKKTNSDLQKQLDECLDKNRVLEVDHMTVKDSLHVLRNETVLLSTENKHMKVEFEKAEKELKTSRSTVEILNKKVLELKEKAKLTKENEEISKNKLLSLEVENTSLSEQLKCCQVEEDALLVHLTLLKSKFTELEDKLASKNSSEGAVSVLLNDSMAELQRKLQLAVAESQSLKHERNELAEILSKETNAGNKTSLDESLCDLKARLLKATEEKEDMKKKMEALQQRLSKDDGVRNRSGQEKSHYKQNIDRLQQQIEDLVGERMMLERELEYLKNENGELRKEIAVILHDNTKLENELDQLEMAYVQLENELNTATDETKALLRELCATETRNLTLNTQQSTHHEKVESYKRTIENLKGDKEENQENMKTLKDRLLMAELEIAQLRAEASKAESHRRLLVGDLENADRDRCLLKGELHQLARTISPLKREVSEAMRKQGDLRLEQDSGLDLAEELCRAKSELSEFSSEKITLRNERENIEGRLKLLAQQKAGLTRQLRELIKDLNQRSSGPFNEEINDVQESIDAISHLLNTTERLTHENDVLFDDVDDNRHNNDVLNIRVKNSNEMLRDVHEELCLATVQRLKLKDRRRQIGQADMRNGDIDGLQRELQKLKCDMKTFERCEEELLAEVRSFHEQLVMVENNLINVEHFKWIVERNLRMYKERNAKLETHLRAIYDDLVEMQEYTENAPSASARVLLETLDLHHHFQSLEDDLRNTESERRNFKEDAADLLERCNALQEEKHVVSVHKDISHMQREREALAYDKARLESKLLLQKSDRKRMLENFQRMSKSLDACLKYNSQLERKLAESKIDFSDMQQTNTTFAATPQNSHATVELLCATCHENVNRNFLGISNNTQLLGDELLDCIHDNMTIMTAICSFMQQKSELEQELVTVETECRDLESRPMSWIGSQLSISSEFN